MGNISRRAHARFQCRLPVRVLSLPSRKSFTGEVLDIGVGGALISVKGILEDSLKLSLDCDGKSCDLDAVVVRSVDDSKDPKAVHRYGVRFETSGRAQDRLKIIIDHLRSIPPEGGDKTVERDYWSL